MATLHKLENDARFAPEKCLRRLLEDMKEGRVKVARLVLVVEDEGFGLSIRAAGPGMDYVPTSIGLLHLGADSLSARTRESE